MSDNHGHSGEKAIVSALESRCTLEIRDLYCLTDKENIKDALKRDSPDLCKVKIGITKENPKGQRIPSIGIGKKSGLVGP